MFKASITDIVKRSNEVLELLGLSWDNLQGRKTLDLGAGSAELVIGAHENSIEITALDRKKPEGIPVYVEYIIADAVSLPYTDETFDYILCIGGPITDFAEIADMTKVAQIIKECVRVLKPGGELRFGIGAKKFQHNIIEIDPRISIHFSGKDNKGRDMYYYKFIKQN